VLSAELSADKMTALPGSVKKVAQSHLCYFQFTEDSRLHFCLELQRYFVAAGFADGFASGFAGAFAAGLAAGGGAGAAGGATGVP